MRGRAVVSIFSIFVRRCRSVVPPSGYRHEARILLSRTDEPLSFGIREACPACRLARPAVPRMFAAEINQGPPVPCECHMPLLSFRERHDYSINRDQIGNDSNVEADVLRMLARSRACENNHCAPELERHEGEVA